MRFGDKDVHLSYFYFGKSKEVSKDMPEKKVFLIIFFLKRGFWKSKCGINFRILNSDQIEINEIGKEKGESDYSRFPSEKWCYSEVKYYPDRTGSPLCLNLTSWQGVRVSFTPSNFLEGFLSYSLPKGEGKSKKKKKGKTIR